MEQLGVFGKYWAPGAVKTRLAKTIGDRHASHIYRELLRTTLIRFADISDRRILAYTPPDQIAPFQHLAGDAWTLQAQAEGDLGRRMAVYFDTAFADGAQAAVLIGSDSPTLPREYVRRAFHLLADYPVVIGPSGDGGYYLIGARETRPAIFSGIDWGTEQVWDQTIRVLESQQTPFAILPSWYDVDDFGDLCQLAAELEAIRTEVDGLEDLMFAVKAVI